MDDYNKQPGQPGYSQSETPGMATAARMKLSDTAADVKEKVADIGRRAADSIDSSRQSAAGALDNTASTQWEPYQLQYTWIPVSSRPGEDHAKIRIARRHCISAILWGQSSDSVSGRLNFFLSYRVHLPEQWFSADPITIESF